MRGVYVPSAAPRVFVNQPPEYTSAFIYDDGGRAAAGYKGKAGDCVVRAIAIAAQLPYERVYQDLLPATRARAEHNERNGVSGRRPRRKADAGTPANGVHKTIWRPYLERLGFTWVPCMGRGTGCQVHLRADELPKGRIIVRASRHLVAVIDGVIHDTYDPSRKGKRCVYGYFVAPS